MFCLTKKSAKIHRIISDWRQLVDAEDDECQHHWESEVSHDAGVMIKQFWVGGIDDKGYEETNAGCYEDVGVKPRKKRI
jgi:hypothetical protein